MCAVICQAEPERYERAALRWIARFCTEHAGATIEDVSAAAAAFRAMCDQPDASLAVLRGLC